MHITLYSMDHTPIATVPVIVDAEGYLYVGEHPTFHFEFECALYGYQEGGVSTDTISDMDSDTPFMYWTVHTCDGKTAPSCAAVDVMIEQIQGIADCERAHAIAVFEEMSAEGFDFSEATAHQFKAQTLDADYVVRMRAAMV